MGTCLHPDEPEMVCSLIRCLFSVGFATPAESFRNNCCTKKILCTLFISFQVQKQSPKHVTKMFQHSKFIFFHILKQQKQIGDSCSYLLMLQQNKDYTFHCQYDLQHCFHLLSSLELHIKAVLSGQKARHPSRNTSCLNLGSMPKKGYSLQNPKLKLMLKWVLNNPFSLA